MCWSPVPSKLVAPLSWKQVPPNWNNNATWGSLSISLCMYILAVPRNWGTSNGPLLSESTDVL
eukprot:9482040-Prorocentrum_lima.AAC.1